MSRASYALVAGMSFAIINTVFLGLHLAMPHQALTNPQGVLNTTTTPNVLQTSTQGVFRFFLANSPTLSSVSWVLVGGVWIWRGKVRSRWESLGFDSALFDLFMKMKGAKTRLSLLDSLSRPKDRFQLAQELGLDWKAVDYHIVLLSKYGLVNEDRIFGNVKMYRLTKQGEILLQLLKEFNRQVPAGVGTENPIPSSA